MNNSPTVRFGSSSPCKGEDRWGSAAFRFSRTPAATDRARHLRHNVTKAEKKLWSLLQRAQMCGCSFRRQHPLGNYGVDFHSPQIRLAIELDGGQHNFTARQIADERRSKWLQNKGIAVLRFWNNEVLENRKGVWDEIARAVATLKLWHTTSTPTLPFSGGRSFGEVDR